MLDRGARQSLAYTHRGTGRSPAYYYLFCIAEFLAGILLKKAKKLLLFSLRCDIMSKLSETAPNTTLEKSRSWSSARDWKSRNRQKRFESSNLSFSAKKEVTFVYQKLLLFLSKPQAWHIITRQRVYHRRRRISSPKVHTPATWWDTTLRVDDIQCFALMICNGKPLICLRKSDIIPTEGVLICQKTSY